MRVTAKDQISQRTPTLCFNLPGVLPMKVTEQLANQNIGVRDGHMYSPRLMKRLGWPGKAVLSERLWCITTHWQK